MSPVAGAGGGCISHASCTEELGTPAICRQRGETCSPLSNDDCPFVFGDYEDEDAIFVGVMGALTGPTPQHREWAQAHVCAVEMVMDWWRENPLPPLSGDIDGRPISVVVCDGFEGSERSLNHLVDDLGVKVVGGPNFSGHVLSHAHELASRGVFMLSPTAGAPQLLEMADNQRFWSVQPNDVEILLVYPPLLELAARWARRANGDRDVKVALLAGGDAMSRGIAQGLIETDSLTFNDLPAVQQTGTNFCPVYLCDSVTDPDCSDEASVGHIARCDPDVVIYLSVSMQWVHAHLNQVEETGTTPLWLFPFRDGEVLAHIRSGAAGRDLQHRLLAVDWTNETNPTYAKFKTSFSGACSDHAPPAVPALAPLTENYYDLVFLVHLLHLADGNYEVPAAELTAGDFVDALLALSGPADKPSELLFGGIPQMIERLVAGMELDVHGASGDLDFDAQRGTPSRQAAVFCVAPGPDPPTTAAWAETGLVFDSKTSRFDGDFACPP